ncbi:TPA: hypothetical protein ACOENT_000053 [Stenotrophomonas maltophilia]
MSEIELKARELLADELDDYSAKLLEEGLGFTVSTRQAMNAIASALAPQWQPIESAPEDGKCLVAVETDDGWWYGQLERDKRGNWIHEGEPTYCKSYYFNPHSWQPLPAPPEVK